MVRLFLSIIFFQSYLFCYSLPVTTTADDLTLKQKVALLFVATNTPQNRSLPFKPLAFSYSESPAVPVSAGQNGVIDLTALPADECAVAYPNTATLGACNNSALIDNLFLSYLKWKPQWSGIISGAYPAAIDQLRLRTNVPVPDRLIVFRGTNASPNTPLKTAALIDLPQLFMSKRKPKSVAMVKSGREAQLPNLKEVFGVDNELNEIGFSLEDILSQPFLFKTDNLGDDVERLARAVERNLIDRQLFEARVQWAFSIIGKVNLNESTTPKNRYYMSQLLARRTIYENSIVLARNLLEDIPLSNFSKRTLAFCDFRVSKSDDYKNHVYFHNSLTRFLNGFEGLEYRHDKIVNALVLCDSNDSLPSVLMQSYKLSQKMPKVHFTLVFCDSFDPAKFIKNDYSIFSSVVLGYSKSPFIWECAVEALFGGIGFQGTSVYDLSNLASKGNQTVVARTKMKIGLPDEVGMCADSLLKIDEIVLDAIDAKATPGAQVLVARHGTVVYQKCFGQTAYQNGISVTNAMLYDVASVSKIMATTPLMMYLVDHGKVNLQKPLKEYLPETKHTNKEAVTLAELLVHKSGLQPNMPTFFDLLDRSLVKGNLFNRAKSELYPTRVDERLYLHRDIRFKDKAVSTFPDTVFSIEIAQGMYLSKYFSDSLKAIMLASPVDKIKSYKYSDLGLGFLQNVVERSVNLSIDRAIDSLFYMPMDLVSIGYKPLEKVGKERIVPTEDDQIFRKQLLQGYVHDPAAALKGGVAGHAGVFSNSSDLAKMMQMYLDGGRYANKQLVKSDVVAKFTDRYDSTSRRGLGFDKPDKQNERMSPVCKQASPSSFGHTGFTGTIVWADPDNGLVFIFLSNRVNPDSWNKKLIQMDVRARAMTVAYSAINQ